MKKVLSKYSISKEGKIVFTQGQFSYCVVGVFKQEPIPGQVVLEFEHKAIRK